MMAILGIDPGPHQSGWCIFDVENHRVIRAGVDISSEVLQIVRNAASTGVGSLAIEMIASYGQAVGRDVFETCLWIGRYLQAWQGEQLPELIYRANVKMFLCGAANAKDPNVRRALLDRFEPTGGGSNPVVGIKSQPGPLFGLSSHAYPALGVCFTAAAGYGYTQGPEGWWAQKQPDLHSSLLSAAPKIPKARK